MTPVAARTTLIGTWPRGSPGWLYANERFTARYRSSCIDRSMRLNGCAVAVDIGTCVAFLLVGDSPDSTRAALADKFISLRYLYRIYDQDHFLLCVFERFDGWPIRLE
jgi:hypothetical protein